MALKSTACPEKVIQKSEQKPHENRKLIIGGLTAFSGACVVQLLGLSHLDLSLQIALWLFALSLPLLIRDLLDIQEEDRHGISINLESRLIATTTGILGSVVGVAAIFWHFSQLAFLLFTISFFWCAWTHTSYSEKLREEADVMIRVEKDTGEQNPQISDENN